MLGKSFSIIVSLSLIILLSSCKENINAPIDQQSGLSEQELISKSISSFPSGKVKLDRILNNDDLWEIYIRMENGAVVKFEYSRGGALREVEGISGPFDYSLIINPKIISYEDAREISLIVKSGIVSSWKFETDDSSKNIEYRFFIAENGDWEVRLNAETGEVTRVRKK